LRYERKYRITDTSIDIIRHVLDLHPAGFSKQFPDRQVNSIYYDDPSFSNVNSNVSGISRRSKYRIRWYGSDLVMIRKPILEKKIKENQLGFKEYEPLEDFNLNTDLFQISQIPQVQNSNLFPVVGVHYQRSYFLSFHKKLRVTIDRSIHFSQISHYILSRPKTIDSAIILEVKYEQSDTKEADQLLNTLPFRITKNSKYLSAVESIWF